MARYLRIFYYLITIPVTLVFLFHSRRIHPAYRLGWFKRIAFGLRVFRNKHSIPTGGSYKTPLVMALKLFELPPEVHGVVIECGTWKGGTAASLSLACRIVGRKLVICDSFEGLPAGDTLDREAPFYKAGDWSGTFDEVRANITKYGDIGCCEFVKGWFQDSLPHFNQEIAAAYLDVDLESSLNTCVLSLWPHLAKEGYIFIDEFTSVNYCALFYSERYWKEHFDRTPPGLIGAGSGLALGEYYVGGESEAIDHPMQRPTGPAYTRKCMSGHWTYYPAARTGEGDDFKPQVENGD